MNITVRNTLPTDFVAVESILAKGRISGPWLTPEGLSKGICHNDGFYLVAEVDGLVVGTVFAQHDGWGQASLYKLGVLASHRRQGVGRMLIEAVLERLKRIGIDYCHCGIRVDNKASLALFQEAGFDVSGEYRYVHKTIPL